ncbi:hypothetical protein VMCG_03388 [Cytospora schulzeri]|uniref:Zn(2)-C6 fungal-type domain-containing protein n=1 Tax=Cytospora schulzeri TaxID=448051 RepID=A0A423WWB6_9PEZI|nr:hypothetical protein VMCG_03388 [Valsa malicola]
MSPSSSSSISTPAAAAAATRQTNNPQAGTDGGPVALHALSCVNCRQRKVKCNKTYPCPHCVKGGLECVFPTRKKDRAPRRNHNRELLTRLAKLEAIVGQVDQNLPGASARAVTVPPQSGLSSISSAVPEAIDSSVAAAQPTITPAAFKAEHRNPQKRCPAAQPVSRDDPAAKYVSGEFWANLSSEVEGIKAALEQPSDDEDDSDGHDETSPESVAQGHRLQSTSANYYVTSPAMFGNAQAASAGEGLVHPAPEKMRRLCETYFRNVDPLIKILHKPTVEEAFYRFMSSPVDNPLGRETEALFFAMYFAAVTSLQPEMCKALLGEDRGLLVVQFRQAAEYALARADYLNSTSLETLQAFTLYSTCLRNHAESRASWAMLALVLRLCQALGIHRDSDGLAFPPYEAEMRRRLWSQIIVLDVRAATDRGTEPMVRQEEYNTLPPTNLNDADFGPQTTVPLAQLARKGTTDVTFSLCTYECSTLFLHIHGPRSRFSKAAHEMKTTTTNTNTNTNTTTYTTAPKSLVHPQMSEEDLVQRIKRLEAQFTTPTPPPPHLHYQSALAISVIRIASLTYWLSIQYPWQVRQPLIKPRVSREHMLQTAVSIMELKTFGPASTTPTITFSSSTSSSSVPSAVARGIDPAEYTERFVWWQDGYTQWHALAVALAELCVQTEGRLVERAWAVVDRVAPVFGDQVADARKGALWRPIRKLLRKARERRAEAQMRRLRIDGGGEGGGGGGGRGGQGVAGAGAGQGPAQAQQTSQNQQQHQQQRTRGSAVNSQPPPLPLTPSIPPEPTARPPPNPATEVGPTGFPLAQDLGEVPDMRGGTWIAAKTNPMSTASTTTTMTPPTFISVNDHNNQWAIDFGDLGTAMVDDGSAGGTQDLDMMDWSHWNEFVNDANVGFDDNHTSPSSEGI